MAGQTLQADASPEKWLFIALITRDITLVAAFLDLLDNSINSALVPYSERLRNAADYELVLNDPEISPSVRIDVRIADGVVSISDNASGISAATAQEHVFKFGRAFDEVHPEDRLSVYGIGLKRALFKLGDDIRMESDHSEGGFKLKLDVPGWAKDRSQPWVFPITTRDPAPSGETGTRIEVRTLRDDVKRRLADGVFPGQLREAIARTYSFFMAKFVTIFVNDVEVEGTPIEMGQNHASQELDSEGVSCRITAGLGVAQDGQFRDRSSGWFVYCNGRGVIAADKSPLTGWGLGPQGLPIFQPKHRPFLGTVFFVAENGERLPWTTTKAGINEDSAIWQQAKRLMAATGRPVASMLSERYGDEGTEVSQADLIEAAGARTSVISAAVAPTRTFTLPKKPKPVSTRIQYDAKLADIKKIEDYLRRPGMGGAEVGRHTFLHFLKNEVGEG